MNLKQMYEFAIQNGIDNDPRGRKEVETLLKEVNEEYKSLSEERKKYFDKDFLINPYQNLLFPVYLNYYIFHLFLLVLY